MMILKVHRSLIWQKILIESFSMIIALAFGIACFNKMNKFVKLLFLQLCTWVVFYALSYAITRYQHANGLPKNNQWLMNIHIPVETGFLIFAAFVGVEEDVIKKLFLGLFVVFFSVFLEQMFMNSLVRYSTVSDVSACIVVSLTYSILLYKSFSKGSADALLKPSRIMMIGILLYFVCSVPYLSLMPYIDEFHKRENTVLFHLVSDVLAALRYLTLGLGFYYVGKNVDSRIVHE